ncbi:uncharacterized protein VTP21DRAFT_3865 [Calcarisporiella thermophila]|uniref:uncharacterized protein n=1 Tax=Calcarisporiella thermophila TaxID=911321 RepID=UPI0037432E6D
MRFVLQQPLDTIPPRILGSTLPRVHSVQYPLDAEEIGRRLSRARPWLAQPQQPQGRPWCKRALSAWASTWADALCHERLLLLGLRASVHKSRRIALIGPALLHSVGRDPPWQSSRLRKKTVENPQPSTSVQKGLGRDQRLPPPALNKTIPSNSLFPPHQLGNLCSYP